MNNHLRRLGFVAIVAVVGSTAAMASGAQAAAHSPSNQCVRKATASQISTERDLASTTANLRAAGRSDAEIEKVMQDDWCLRKVSTQPSATSKTSTLSTLGDDGGVGDTDLSWSTSLWYDAAITPQGQPGAGHSWYYAIGVWRWNNHDYADNIGIGCWPASIGSQDGLGLRFEGAGQAQYDVKWAGLYYWGDPALDHFSGDYEITSIESDTAGISNGFGIEYLEQDEGNRIQDTYNLCTDANTDLNMFGGEIVLKFATLDDYCHNTKVYAINVHTWSSTALNNVGGSAPFGFSAGWVTGDSKQAWQTINGATGSVCGPDGRNNGIPCSCGPGRGGSGGGSPGALLPVSQTSRPAVFDPNNSNVEVYFNSSGILMENFKNSTSWSGPQTLNTAVADRPTTIWDPNNGNIEVYFSSGGVLTEKFWSPTSGWGGGTVGGNISGRPTVVYNPNNKNVEVYFNSDGVLREKYWSPTSGWSGLLNLGSAITGSPAAIFNPANKNIEIYFNSNGILKEQYWIPSSGWSGEVAPGGALSGSPEVIYNPYNTNMEVYFNSGGVVTENFHTPTGWSGSQTVGGSISGDPTAAYNKSNGNIEVYFNSGGALHEDYWSPTDGWSINANLGGSVSGIPWAFYNPNRTNVEVYYQSGTSLVANFHSASAWSGQQAIGGTITG